MIQVQFRIKFDGDVDIETDLLEREDANDNERSIAREIEGMTEAVLTGCAKSIGIALIVRNPAPACSASLVAQPPRDVSELYHELLYAVERCFPGESRHETALRYIRETERRVSEVGSCMQNARLDRKEEAR